MEFTTSGDVGEDDASQEQRIEWLRQRGVKIEFPEGDPDGERATSTTTGAPSGLNTRIITCVKIPQNTNKPYETLEVAVSEVPSTSDPMMEALKKEFSAGATDAMVDKLVADASDMGISRSTLLKLATEGQVDTFPLARPRPDNNYIGVTMYVDELGQAKGLERNPRAAALADFCGFKQVPLLGDVIVARHAYVMTSKLDKGGRAYNALDFTQEEMDSSADWVRDCEKANYEYGVQTGQVSMDPDAARRAAQSKPTLVSVDGGASGVEPGATSGLASTSTVVEHVTWEETADYTVELVIDLVSILRAHVEKNGLSTSVDPDTIALDKKNVAVSIKGKSVGVGIKLPECTAMYAISLAGAVSPDESTWTFSGTKKQKVEMTLEKTNDLVWGRLEE